MSVCKEAGEVMKFNDLRKKSKEDLEKEVVALREEIFQLRFKQGIDDLDDLHKIRSRKKDLARVLTALRQSEMEGASS
jgi:large subunit ribosomal protein L29